MRFEADHRASVEGIQAYYMSRVTVNETALQSYGQMLIRSLITLNAGAAIAYPTVAELLLQRVPIEAVMWPVCLSVLGVILGLLCGWAAYFNHSLNSHFFDSSMEEAILKADEHFDNETYHQFRTWRKESKEWYASYIEKTEKRSNQFYWAANILGFMSAFSMATSLVLFGWTIS
ncbi:MAG: hypothetical protein AAF996_17050 [Pseudomonadota bacterium]